jgi:hypothetical protein
MKLTDTELRAAVVELTAALTHLSGLTDDDSGRTACCGFRRGAYDLGYPEHDKNCEIGDALANPVVKRAMREDGDKSSRWSA